MNVTRGILKSLLFYGTGLALGGLSYVTVGHEYVHGPGLHHVIIFLTVVGGFVWLIGAAINYFIIRRTETLKGIILCNLIMSVAFTLFMVYVINGTSGTEEPEKELKKITITESGDTTTVHHRGSIVYIKIKDSVYIDYIDSAKINWDEVEFKKK